MSTESALPEVTPKFGTFTGVFTPTLLTILGVIMYVRMGWVVGNAGLMGSMLILGLAMMITTCTGLSLSSIATNTRIGAGGPYAILNKSLGLEVGGSIGIPLYLTRPLGVAMYIFGFREGLTWIVPTLPPLVVDLAIFGVLFGIAYKSADLAFKTQYVIMGVIAVSLISIFLSPAPRLEISEIQWWGTYPGDPEKDFVPGAIDPAVHGTDFWGVFAVFFPATTGILAGANMSGDLKDPRRAIPIGTMAAILLSAVLYFAITLFAARTAPLDELASNYTHVIDTAAVPGLVLAGLLGATASSALAGLVGGPRILMAMGQNRLLPASSFLAATREGEPRNAMAVTGVLTLAAIMVRDLNAIAPLVTMFFLITYCMINVVVLIEGGLGLVSYRPTLHVPLVVPLLGLVGCAFSMFIVNPAFSLIAVVMVLVTYWLIHRQGLEHAEDGVRSSIFVAVAEWAASQVTPDDTRNERAWKPHLLVPVEDVEELRGSYPVLLDLARPEGSVKLLGMSTIHSPDELRPRLAAVTQSMRDKGVLASEAIVGLPGYTHAVAVGMMALQGAFFTPNLLFARLPRDPTRQEELREVIRHGLGIQVGACLLSMHPAAGLGQQRDIHLWVRGPQTWRAHDAFETGNLNLNLLMGYRLWRLWRGRLTLHTVAPHQDDEPAAARFLDELCDLARFPAAVKRTVQVGEIKHAICASPPADLSIFGLDRTSPDFDRAALFTEWSRSSCLFVLDSGRESARA